MKNNWETYRLGDVTKWYSGGTPKKSESSYWGGSIPWISASSMDGHLYRDSKLKITEEGLKNGSRLAPANSVLLLVRGSILHQKIQVGLTTKEVAFNQDVKCLVPKEEFLDSWYLLLWFKAKERELLNLVESTGIGAGKFDTKLLSEYPIEIPPKHELAAIKKFGKALFDKSSNLVSTNQILEQMAQALFKSWFVDFDPVVDNALAAGNPIPDELGHRVEVRKKAHALPDFQPLPEDIRSLFPSEFEQTGEVTFGIGGWIPKGWEYKKFKEVIDKYIDNRGKTPPLSREGYPLVEVKNLPANGNFPLTNSEKRVDEKTFRSWFRQYVREKDILISTVGTIGRSSFVKDVDIGVAQNVLGLRFEKLATPEFMFYTIKGHKFQHDVDSRLVITVQASIKRKDLNTIDILLPNISIQNKFSEIVDGYLTAQYCRALQNQTLEASRDALLPKLISGEIKLQPASKNIQEAELQGV